ncbi:MAG: TolC family protein [Candidatus Kapabacteria bacterium]|nr:TolC family protein [Candidatus Kapabacteria bacterium]
MYKNLFLCLLFIISLIFNIFNVNAKPLGINDVLNEALKNHPDIQISSKNIKIAESELLTAGLRPNPNANFVLDMLPVGGEKYNPFHRYYGASLNIPLDINNHLDYKVEMSKLLVQAAQYQHLDILRQFKLRVRLAFVTTLALRDKIELGNDNYKRLNEFNELSKIRLKNNDIPEVDLVRAEFIRDKYKSELEASALAYKESLVDLQYLMGRQQLRDTLELESDIENIEAPDSNSEDMAFNIAIKARPDIKWLIEQNESEKANLKLQQSYSKPDYAIQGDFSSQQLSYFWGLSLNISLPLFNQNQGEIQKSQVQIQINDLVMQSMQLSLAKEIHNARENMIINYRIVKDHIDKLIPQSKEILKTVEYSYKTGATTFIDYMEAQRGFNETMINYIDDLFKYHLSKNLFLSAIGKD